MNTLLTMLSFPFLQRAFAVGIPVSLCAALLGVCLVLKRYAMIGDGLSHVSYGAIAIAVALGAAPLPFSVPIVIVAAFFLLRMTEQNGLRSDAAIAVLSTSALSVGVIVSSLSAGSTDAGSYLFGSILATTETEVILSVSLSAGVLALFVLFYHRIFAVTFDESFARATGVNTGFYNSLIAILTALTVVLGMRLMGAMLISSLLIFPALSAMRLLRSFVGVVVCAGAVSLVCFTGGLILSFTLNTPVGATVVLCNLAVFLLFSAVGRFLRGK